MRFTINLATRTHLDHRLLNKIAFSAIAVLLLITVWNVSRVLSHMSEQSRLNAEISAIQGKLGARPVGITEADFSRQKARIRFYNEIIERKSSDWIGLLDMIENATPNGLTLSSLSPVKKEDELKLAGSARSFKAVQQYLEKLESSENFSNVLLLSHTNMNADEKVSGVQFTISCKVIN